MSNSVNFDDLIVLEKNREFIGREFLTWLWFKSETNQNKIVVKDYGTFDFYVDDKIILSGNQGSVQEHALKGKTPAYSNETGSALISGKMVKEIKFVLQNDHMQFFFTIVSSDLSIKNLKTKMISQSDNTHPLEQKISLIKTLNDIIENLHKEYMILRSSDKISDEIKEIREWVRQKNEIQTHQELQDSY